LICSAVVNRRSAATRSPRPCATAASLAVVHTKQGHIEEAMRHYDAALDILEQTLGSAHPTTVTCRCNRVRVAG
jgi:hypothetical protein